MEKKKFALSLNGDAFNSFKLDFDQMLRELLTEMERRESPEATISMKMVVNLEGSQERDFESNGYDAMKDIVKPTFKHEISTVMQVKKKKSGSLGGNMKMVWDRDLCQYVLKEIDNGQTSLFNENMNDQEAPADTEDSEVVGLPAPTGPADAITVPYEVIEGTCEIPETDEDFHYDEPGESERDLE